MLVGTPNRFFFDRDIARQLIRFGKYIFFATVGGYIINQADRAILGKLLSLDALALYSIGLMLASLPRLFAQTVSAQVIFPLYARRPPWESEESRRKINTARRLLTGGAFLLSAVLAAIGIDLIIFLYDPRYEAAGPMVVLIALTMIPPAILISYHRLPMAAGHSARFAVITITLALLQLSTLFIGGLHFGLAGITLAPAIGNILFYPVLIYLIRSYKSWDPLHDALYFSLYFVLVALIFWWHGDQLWPLFKPL